MIHLYLDLQPFEIFRSKCDIDMSKIPAERLADECDNILQHHKTSKLFFGYLDPGWMLDPRHEARIRNTIRKFEVHMVTFHLESIPHAWKNEIDTVYVKTSKDGGPKTINDGCAIQAESETEN
jgi:hypothetical protein